MSILDSQTAYERATKFAETKRIFSQGAYGRFWGATAGGVIGAAIGIVTGENVLAAAGKDAAAGGAAGATIGGVGGCNSADEARRAIIRDLQAKSLQQKPIVPQSLSYPSCAVRIEKGKRITAGTGAHLSRQRRALWYGEGSQASPRPVETNVGCLPSPSWVT